MSHGLLGAIPVAAAVCHLTAADLPAGLDVDHMIINRNDF
jgi:hypothetical protein